jgi:Ni,Fe-hydrogenase III small subunit
VPVSRLQRIAVREPEPAFLCSCGSCGSCGSLWIETLRFMAPISPAEAATVFPDYESDRQ